MTRHFALLLLLVGKPSWAQRPESLPDIDVTYIERTPRYPGYRPDYDTPSMAGVPVLADPHTHRPLTRREIDAVKRWPAEGDTVTFTAHVANNGPGAAPPFEFCWYLDGVEAGRGRTTTPLVPGGEATAELKWKWQAGRHTVRFTADPLFKVRDLSLTNNSREDATDAWSLIWAVDRHTYEEFSRRRNFLGTTSFEDWAQWHIDRMNHLFDLSPLPAGFGPSGVQAVRRSGRRPQRPTPNAPRPFWRPRVRCDRIVVVEDVERAWDRTLGNGVQPLDAGYDGAWAFGRRDDCTEWAANADWGLIHEWGHQLGLTDEYALDRPGFQNMVADESGDPLLIGHMASLAGFMMHGHGPTLFSPECMAALCSQQGRRRGYYGDYYYCTPALNLLRVLDVRSKPVEGAQIAAWQDKENAYGGAPIFTGSTDASGLFTLPARPAPHVTTELGFTQRDNPLGKIGVVGPGDVLFLRIQARGQTEYTWLEIAELNLAYWNGDRERAVYTRATHIPPPGAPAAPAGVTATVKRDAVELAWQPVVGAKAYRVYHAAPDLYRFDGLPTPVEDTSWRGKLGNGALHRYSVTAVAADGTESALSAPAGAMHFLRPWGIVALRDGRRLIRDAGYGQAVLQKADGNTVGLVGSVHYHFEGSFDLALDPTGRILSAKWGDGYNPQQGFRVQDPQLNLVVDYLRARGKEPGQVDGPMGIAADSQGSIFIADTGNNRVQEFTPEGKFVQIIGAGELSAPMKVAFDKQGRMYVADRGHDRIAIYERSGAPAATGAAWKLVRSLSEGIKEPVYVLVDERGRMYVSSREAGVQMFDEAGKLAWKWSGPEKQTTAPRGLALDPQGNLLVVDEAGQRVLSIKPP